ncbi:tetratricopeptide repeat protein [Sulfurovum sp. CS9]|uniref:tetratricopeptide repeat protein n=1 Tax=Sulfurovum sp. CS9 TaxID=3391146 RepID=UPI0039E89A84
MSWNRIVLFFITVFFFHTGAVQAKELRVLSEDELIIQGLLYEEYRAFDRSRYVFGQLYDTTGAKVYLFKEMTASLFSKTNIDESIKRLKIWDEKHPDTLEVKRLLIPLYLTANRVGEAKTEAEHLLERSNKAMDMELASNPFLYTGEFKRALDLLSKVYEKTSNEDVLLRMVVIMDEYTNERIKAIQLLETHRHMNIVSNDVYFTLLSLYVKENNVDGLLRIYKILYDQDKDEKYLNKIIDAYAYKRDIDGAIVFLEKNKTGERILYELYKRKKLFDKAFNLIDSLYAEKKDPRWLAEKGVLLFEKSEDKNDKKMIKEVISYFEKAIDLGVDDSIYLNYYGYTLIDKEVDVKKGIKIIENALKQQPHNTYYLDSLAWGYYKENKCKKAYEMMKKVVDEEGLDEKEIIEHWELIQKCK